MGASIIPAHSNDGEVTTPKRAMKAANAQSCRPLVHPADELLENAAYFVKAGLTGWVSRTSRVVLGSMAMTARCHQTKFTQSSQLGFIFSDTFATWRAHSAAVMPSRLDIASKSFSISAFQGRYGPSGEKLAAEGGRCLLRRGEHSRRRDCHEQRAYTMMNDTWNEE